MILQLIAIGRSITDVKFNAAVPFDESHCARCRYVTIREYRALVETIKQL